MAAACTYREERKSVVHNRMDAAAVLENWSDVENEDSDISSDESEHSSEERERTAVMKMTGDRDTWREATGF